MQTNKTSLTAAPDAGNPLKKTSRGSEQCLIPFDSALTSFAQFIRAASKPGLLCTRQPRNKQVFPSPLRT